MILRASPPDEARKGLSAREAAADGVLHHLPALQERLEDPRRGQLALGGLRVEEDLVERLAALRRDGQ
jgi:hypothetical protein